MFLLTKKKSEKNLEVIGLWIVVPQDLEFLHGALMGKKAKNVFLEFFASGCTRFEN